MTAKTKFRIWWVIEIIAGVHIICLTWGLPRVYYWSVIFFVGVFAVAYRLRVKYQTEAR